MTAWGVPMEETTTETCNESTQTVRVMDAKPEQKGVCQDHKNRSLSGCCQEAVRRKHGLSEKVLKCL